jgi:hypothetical protein
VLRRFVNVVSPVAHLARLGTRAILSRVLKHQGRDQEEAVRNLIEAAQLFIESCFERNVLDEVLKNCGFAPGRPRTERELPHDTRPYSALPGSATGRIRQLLTETRSIAYPAGCHVLV